MDLRHLILTLGPMAGVRVWAGVWLVQPDPNPNQTRDLTPGVCHTRDNP
jgi:hypothetical protein